MALDILTGMMYSSGWNDTDRRPMNWRETISYLYPNGKAPLTALLGLIDGKELTDDAQYHWWTKTLVEKGINVAGIYSDASLTTAYNPSGESSIAAIGDTLYLDIDDDDNASDDYKKFRAGQTIMLVDKDDTQYRFVAMIDEVSSTQMTITMLTAGDWQTTKCELEDVDRALVVGNANEEGAGIPDIITFEPVKYYNYTQIFRTPIGITRTGKKTRLRTGNQVEQAKKEALEDHSVDLEMAFLFGSRSERTGPGGMPIRTTDGIYHFKDKDDELVVPRAAFSGTWAGTETSNGYYWLMTQLEILFRYGSDTKICFCGNGALLGINWAAAGNHDLTIEGVKTDFGMNFQQMTTPFGQVMFKTHPKFNQTTHLRKLCMFLDPANLNYRYIDDTDYYPERQANDIDGEKSEYLTEAGLELHHGETFRILENVG
jgi:hypothetical protein